MDLLRVKPPTLVGIADWQGWTVDADLVEDWTTLIWTERYTPAGEFELHTPKILETRAALPEGSLVTLRDSREVMKVETHSIEVDDEGEHELVIKGRTVEAPLLEGKIFPGYGGVERATSWNMRNPYTVAEAALTMLWDCMANESYSALGGPSGSAPAKPRDLLVSDGTTNTWATTNTWVVSPGEVYSQFLDILTAGNLGIRNIRPDTASALLYSIPVTVPPGGGPVTFGLPTRTPAVNVGELLMEVYTGVDRSNDQSVRPVVIFDYNSGDLENPEYLFSVKDLREKAWVTYPGGAQSVLAPGVTEFELLSNRPLGAYYLYLDAGDGVFDPANPTLTFNAVRQFGLAELAKHTRQSLLNAAVSATSGYKYGRDYFLGDRVTVNGEYGLRQTMVVMEYVRTENQDGERGYPTLILKTGAWDGY